MSTELKIEMRSISKIRPYIKNPRINDKTVELLVKIIPKVGFNVPLVIDKNGVIVKGHARYTAAIRLGMIEVPCIVSDADEDTIKLDRIMDNKVSEFTEWITDDLIAQADALDVDFDLRELGLPVTPKFDDIPKVTPKMLSEPISEDAEQEMESYEKAAKRYYKAVCPHCGHIQFVPEDEI